MGKIQFGHGYEDIISIENLLEAWEEFVKGKRSKKDVQEFGKNLLSNLSYLHADLASGDYRHSDYIAFNISDPKPRKIHKAEVRDRVLHHAIYRQLYPFFDRTFISDSYSCRVDKGTHRAIARFQSYAAKVSRNHTKTCWVLKCDIKKFFASIDHKILLELLGSYIPDEDVMRLLGEIINSFSTQAGKGLPLGNLTSQLFCNVYMNQLDQFVKHSIKAKQYIRYADDFVLLSDSKNWLEQQIPRISDFLADRLGLAIHPDKIFIKTIASGVDFLGWINFTDHRVLRSATKRRMIRRIREHPTEETMESYLGLLSHGNAIKIRGDILELHHEMKRISSRSEEDV